MMKLIILLIIILTCLSCTTTPVKWTKTEKAKEAAWLILHAVDYKQTQYAMEEGGFKELNPLLGEHPSEGRLNTFALLGAVLHFVTTHYIEKEYRAIWQNITIGTKAAVVGWNFHVGAKVEF